MKLYRAFATVGGLTAISRVLGFVRDMLLAAVMGTGWVADAFFVSFRFPNLFRALFAEGAFNSAFVPLFSKRLHTEGKEAAHAFAEQALAVLLVAVTAVVILGEIFMPQLIHLIAWGFTADDQKFQLTVLLARIGFPYLICMSLVALTAGMLNAHHKFAAPAATPIIMNLVFIVVTLFAVWLGFRDSPDAGVIQAWGVAIAGFAQLMFVAFAARRMGLDLGFVRPRITPEIKLLFKRGVPGLVTGGINQLNIFAGTVIASFGASAVSYLNYADRLNQLPLGVVGIAIGVVLLPDLSAKLAQGDEAAVMASQNRSFEFALLLTLPAAVALMIMPAPLVRVLFEHGAFTSESTAQVAVALAAFAIGLPAFNLTKVLLPGFFAREDTRTPMMFAGAAMATNVIGSLATFFVIGHVGIALATSLAGWVNVALLAITLMRRGHFKPDAALKRNVPRIALASAAMGAALWFTQPLLAPYFAPSNGIVIQIGALLALVAAGGFVYALGVQVTGVVTVRGLRRALARGA